jgi:ribonuclease HII
MHTPLLTYHSETAIEAGVDEAGRGCLAGPVFAAAVILPKDLNPELKEQLNDSKKLTEKQRYDLRVLVEANAISFAVAIADQEEIDTINILNASFLAMHRAIAELKPCPELLLIDGNRFRPFDKIDHCCIIKGDGIYCSIAAASILAKTYRDDFMQSSHITFPQYGWKSNKGYPTPFHRTAIAAYGLTPLHRKSFNWRLPVQTEIEFEEET